MKKTLAAFALVLATFSITAPAFACTEENCPFKDKSLCATESIYNND